MTHEDFLQAILADPGDDTPRLVYADWLEERGGPRGEFIRVQCELEPWRGFLTPGLSPGSACGLPGGRIKGGKELLALRAREGELLGRHQAEWIVAAPPLNKILRGGGRPDELLCRPQFRRGFVASIILPTQAFLGHAADLFRAAPIEEVRLIDCPEGILETFEEVVQRMDNEGRLRKAGVDLDDEGKVILHWSDACVHYGRKLVGLPHLPA